MLGHTIFTEMLIMSLREHKTTYSVLKICALLYVVLHRDEIRVWFPLLLGATSGERLVVTSCPGVRFVLL